MQPGPGADSQVGFFQLAHVIDTCLSVQAHVLSTSCTACNAPMWLAEARSADMFGRESQMQLMVSMPQDHDARNAWPVTLNALLSIQLLLLVFR